MATPKIMPLSYVFDVYKGVYTPVMPNIGDVFTATQVAEGDPTLGEYAALVRVAGAYTARKKRDANRWHPVNGTTTSKAKTQKVRGLRALRSLIYGSSYHLCKWRWASAESVLKMSRNELLVIPYPIFARPCPVVPRHGFVDSQVATTPENLQDIARLAVEADPDAEIIVCPFIDAKYSAIATPNTFSFGRGHEGATSGQSLTIYGPVPAAGSHVDHVAERATVAEGDVVYLEAVYGNDPYSSEARLVQARGGPLQGAVVDYVPSTTKVTSVLVAKEGVDLLKWEGLVAKAKPGTVVYAPGMSLANHYCVHAVINKVPVLTTRQPEVGETLKETGVPKWKAKDWRRLAECLEHHDHSLANALSYDTAHISVIGLHLAGTPSPASQPQLSFLARAAVATVKHLVASCLGEARHAPEQSRTLLLSKDRTDKVAGAIHQRSYSCGRGEDCRSVLYWDASRGSIETLAQAMYAVVPLFRERDWDSSYGGKRWGEIAAATRRMAHNMHLFMVNPNERRWRAVVNHWNRAIHLVHNGKASALSKWGVAEDFMDKTAEWPIGALLILKGNSIAAAMGMTTEQPKAELITPAKKVSQSRRRTTERLLGSVATTLNTGSSITYFADRAGTKMLRAVSSDVLKEKIKGLATEYSLPSSVFCGHPLSAGGVALPVTYELTSKRRGIKGGTRYINAVNTLNKLCSVTDRLSVEERVVDKVIFPGADSLSVAGHNIKV